MFQRYLDDICDDRHNLNVQLGSCKRLCRAAAGGVRSRAGDHRLILVTRAAIDTASPTFNCSALTIVKSFHHVLRHKGVFLALLLVSTLSLRTFNSRKLAGSQAMG